MTYFLFGSTEVCIMLLSSILKQKLFFKIFSGFSLPCVCFVNICN